MSFWDQLVKAGSAYVKHVNVIRQLVEAAPEARNSRLAEYVRGLSDTSFAGFKVLLFNVMSEEKNAQARSILDALMRNCDAARKGGTPVSDAPAPPAAALDAGVTVEAQPPRDSFDADLALLNRNWVKNPDLEKKRTTLVDFLIDIDEARYQSFQAHLAQMEINQATNIKAHKANELNSWGRFFEDRMAYFNARERTGQRDPKFMAGLRELESGMADIQWVMKSCESFWPVIQKRKQAAASQRPASVSASPGAGG